MTFCNLFVAIFTSSVMENNERSSANISASTSRIFGGSDKRIAKR